MTGERQRGDVVFAFLFVMLPVIRQTDSARMPAVLQRGHPLQKSYLGGLANIRLGTAKAEIQRILKGQRLNKVHS